MSDEITQDDLKKCILAEIEVLIGEEREKIIKRAHKRLREMKRKDGQALPVVP